MTQPITHVVTKGEAGGANATCSCGWSVEADTIRERARATLAHLKERNAHPRTGREMLPGLAQCPDRHGEGGCSDDGEGFCLYCGLDLAAPAKGGA